MVEPERGLIDKLKHVGHWSVIAEYTESDSNPSAPQWSKSYVFLGGRLLSTLTPQRNGHQG
jgi:hypothetical protein